MKRYPPKLVCGTCNQVIKEHLQTLDDVYRERVKLLIDAAEEVDMPDDVFDKAQELEEKLANGHSITLAELQWLNQAIDSYALR